MYPIKEHSVQVTWSRFGSVSLWEMDRICYSIRVAIWVIKATQKMTYG